MLKYFVLCSLVALTKGGLIPEGSVDVHIVGGTNASVEDFPFIVSMQRGSRHACGGSIIAPKFIVTASHCLYGRKASDISFRAGSSTVNKNGIVVKAKAIHLHPKFNYRTFDYDVAVVELQTALNYSDSIKAISLVKTEPGIKSKVQATGWGHLWHGGKSPKILQTVVVPMVNRTACAKKYGEITNRMICAGKEGKDSCQGDSGGPLTIHNRLCGLVSFGKGCAWKDYPGVYTNLANREIASFIKKFIKK